MKKFLEREHTSDEYLAKLAEEQGEVAQEYLKIVRSKDEHENCDAVCALIEELKHVELVAKKWRKALQKEADERWS